MYIYLCVFHDKNQDDRWPLVNFLDVLLSLVKWNINSNFFKSNMLTSWYYLYFFILCQQLKTKIDQPPWPLSCRYQSTPTLPLQGNEGGTAVVLISPRPVFFHCFLVICLKAGCRTNATLWLQPFYCSFFSFLFWLDVWSWISVVMF